MPTRAQTTATTGKEPKEDGSERYKAALAALDRFHTQAANDIAGPRDVAAQAAVLQLRLDAITAAIVEYLKPGKFGKSHAEGRVGLFFKQVLAFIGRERSIIADAVFRQERSGGTAYVNTPWTNLLAWNDAQAPAWTPTSTSVAPLDVTGHQAAGGAQAGGQKSTTPLRSGQYEGRFAADDKVAAAPKWVLNKYGGTFKAGDPGRKDAATAQEDPRLSQRSVAMSRLDAMLGGGVIARTEFAVRNGVLGTYMKEAKGKQLRQALVDNDVTTADQPNLARLLSRLQLIDAIAGQVDRHRDNFFVRFTQHDKKVIEVTGIDLDLAWVTKNFDVTKPTVKDWYPGFSRFVDEQLALRIIAIDPQEVRLVLADLLTQEQLDLAIGRLVHLKQLLGELAAKGKLLNPNQWTQMTELHEENTSYMAKAMNKDLVGGFGEMQSLSATEYVATFPNKRTTDLRAFLVRNLVKTTKNEAMSALTALQVPERKQAAELRKIKAALEPLGLLSGKW